MTKFVHAETARWVTRQCKATSAALRFILKSHYTDVRLAAGMRFGDVLAPSNLEANDTTRVNALKIEIRGLVADQR